MVSAVFCRLCKLVFDHRTVFAVISKDIGRRRKQRPGRMLTAILFERHGSQAGPRRFRLTVGVGGGGRSPARGKRGLKCDILLVASIEVGCCIRSRILGNRDATGDLPALFTEANQTKLLILRDFAFPISYKTY